MTDPVTDHEALDLDAIDLRSRYAKYASNVSVIIASAQDVPALIAEVRRLRERIPLIAAEAKEQQRDADVAALNEKGDAHRQAMYPVDSAIADGYARAAALLAAAPLIGEDKSHD